MFLSVIWLCFLARVRLMCFVVCTFSISGGYFKIARGADHCAIESMPVAFQMVGKRSSSQVPIVSLLEHTASTRSGVLHRALNQQAHDDQLPLELDTEVESEENSVHHFAVADNSQGKGCVGPGGCMPE
jgi:hypothetical protein